MEIVRDFIPCQDTDRGAAPAGRSGVDDALAALRGAGSTAVGDTALRDFQTASDFAGTVEEIARIVEYLQLVAADAVDRTRKQSAAVTTTAGTAWTTGWRMDSDAVTGPGAGCGPGFGAGTGPGAAGPDAVPAAASAPGALNAPPVPTASAGPAGPAGPGCPGWSGG